MDSNKLIVELIDSNNELMDKVEQLSREIEELRAELSAQKEQTTIININR